MLSGKSTVKLQVKKTNSSTTDLTLYNVAYLLQCLVNLFGVSKLIKLGGYVKPGKVIYLRKRKEAKLCQVNNNLFLIKTGKDSQALVVAVDILAVPGVALAAKKTNNQKKPKKLDIDLWH